MGLGRADGRRTTEARLLPNLGSMPFTGFQKQVLDAKAWTVQNTSPWIHPNLNFYNPPADSEPFTVTPSPFPSYPAVGQGPTVVIAMTVPRSKLCVIRYLSIVHVGGNPPDGTGIVVWRVLRNGGGIRGLANLTSQYGTLAAPKQVSLILLENDTIQVTAECPATLPGGGANPGPPAGSSTAASFDGFFYPLSEAINPQQGLSW